MPLFHQRSHWYSYVSSCSHLGAARKHCRPDSWEAPAEHQAALCTRTSALHFLFSSPPTPPLWPSQLLRARRVELCGRETVSRNLPRPLHALLCLYCRLTANPVLSSHKTSKIKWKPSVASVKQVNSVASKLNEFPTFSVASLWDHINFIVRFGYTFSDSFYILFFIRWQKECSFPRLESTILLLPACQEVRLEPTLTPCFWHTLVLCETDVSSCGLSNSLLNIFLRVQSSMFMFHQSTACYCDIIDQIGCE